MNASLSFKELATKQYKLTAKERLMVIVAIGIIIFSITIYISTSEVTVEPTLPNGNVQKTVNNASKPALAVGKQLAQVNSIEQPIRDPFAKLPEANNQKSDKDLDAPVIHNNVPSTLPGGIPSMVPKNISTTSSIPQKDFKLTGIVSGADRCLAVIMSGSKSKAYGINDMIGAYTLTAINTDAIVLTNAGDTVVLYLDSVGQKEGKISEK